MFYGSDGAHHVFTNTGMSGAGSLIESFGQLDVWGGVTLQNNDKKGNFGSAIYSEAGSALNMYGGTVTKCATMSQGADRGMGAVYVGSVRDGDSWTEDFNGPNDGISTSFTMYGGYIENNTVYGKDGAADGGGVALDHAAMAMYGGEISYNHAGLQNVTEYVGDGGGVMVRCGSVMDLHGGSVHHNFAAGYGGGVVAWNATINIHGGEISSNTAGYGGGVGIAAWAATESFSYVNMDGGLVAYNEAMVTQVQGQTRYGGYGGGICAGSGNHKKDAHLALSGGTILQNKAVNGGGLAIYAEGDGTAAHKDQNTEATLSGSFTMTGNTAYQKGGGMYIINMSQDNKHHLLTMSGGARIDTQNTVYFENVSAGQIPVLVSGVLDKAYIGTVGIFEFSGDFWSPPADYAYDHAAEGRKIVEFSRGAEELDIQENKFGLDSTVWYLKATPADPSDTAASGYLTLQQYDQTKQYWIRNGTPVEIDAGDGTKKPYYRIYDDLGKAFDDAENGDTLYIFYNATMMSSAVVKGGKALTLLAESSSSAGVAAGLSAGSCQFDTTHQDKFGYYVMTGQFLVQDGSGAGVSANVGGTGKTYYMASCEYNVRNDYTITLSGALKLNEEKEGGNKAPAAIVVEDGSLDFGQETQAGIGYGSLAFDGNYSYPLDGPMLKVEAGSSATIHSGVTLKNHTNISTTIPGTVYNEGAFTMEDGSAVINGVSPLAGAVYNKGAFTMAGGSLTGNTGAMPRTGAGTDTEGDALYHGQPKYYCGAGAVYAAGGTFEMSGGAISGSRGEWGAVAGLGGELDLIGGTISGNAAIQGTGEKTMYDLSISGYTDAGIPDTSSQPDPGAGGGLYLGGGTARLGGVTISGNWAQRSGGGVAKCGGTVIFTGEMGDTQITKNTAKEMGGGIYITGGGERTTVQHVALTGNNAEAGGGLAALGAAGAVETAVTISSSVSSNTAAYYGGGVYVGAYSDVTVEGADLQDNTAVYGGGAYVDCAKTVIEDGTETTKTGPVNPGAVKGSSAEELAKLGTDVPGSQGTLTLKNARINNNHLPTDDSGATVGFGSGAYSRGRLVLDEGAYASGNDRLYLEKDHLIELTGAYEGKNQTPANRLTINSRIIDLGTDVIQMADGGQYKILLAQDNERIAHYQGIPMAQDSENNRIIELNYYTITYYDRLEKEGDLESHCVTDMVVPGQPYTILGWDAANNLKDKNGSTKVMQIEPGKSLGLWTMAEMKDGKPAISDTSGAMRAGETYHESRNLILVADFTTNNYLAVTLNELEGSEEKSEIGGVKLTADELTTSSDGQQSYFSKGMEMDLVLNTEKYDNGHQKGILTSLTIYKSDRSAVNSTPNEDERVFGQFIYTPVERAVFKSIRLDAATAYDKTGIPVDWEQIGDKTLSGELGYDETRGVLTYKGGTDNILIVAKFAPPAVELEMTAESAGGETAPVLTEYYDTMHHAFTRMAYVMNGNDGAYAGNTWGACTITPLTADETGRVYYYGAGHDTVTDGLDAATADADVVFDLNSFTLDLQNMPAQTLNACHLTLENGTVSGGAAAGSRFVVNAGGKLTLKGATLAEMPEGAYNVTVNADDSTGGILEMDQDSHAGRVLLKGVFACINAMAPKTWPEFVDAPGALPAAVIYTDLGGLVTKEGTSTNRQVIGGEASRAASPAGHSLRSHFVLADAVTDDLYGDETARWFIGTDGYLYPRIKDVIPRLVCIAHPDATVEAQIRKETETSDAAGNNKQPVSAGSDRYYPVYYLYSRAYGYNNDADDKENGHPLSIVTTLKDAYGNKVSNAGGVVTVTMAQVVDGVKNRVLTARVQISQDEGTYIYTGTSANPVFPAGSTPYYFTGSFTGENEYAAAYANYWKIKDENRADNGMSSMSGLSKLTIDAKEVSEDSVVVTSVTPSSASYIGAAGAAASNTSRAGTVRVRDEYTGLNLTSGDDLQIYYRRLTKDSGNNRGVAGQTDDGTTYYYADDMYYTATGQWYGVKEADGGPAASQVAKIDGQPVGLYSVELAAIKQGDPQSINYTGVSGWKGYIFTITPYSGRLNTAMKNNVAIQNVEDAGAVRAELQKLIQGLQITDIYGNRLDQNKVTYTFVPADSNAKVDENGWPCTQGLYSIEIHPYGSGAVNAVTQGLVGTPTPDANYSASAAGYQALLITKEPLTMEIQVDNSGAGTNWQTDTPLDVPYTGDIYRDGDVKAYDRTYAGSTGDNFQVVKKASEGGSGRLNATQYTLQVGLPDDPARDAGRHVLVATDSSGQYVAIGSINVTRNLIADVQIDPDSTIYTGKRIDPKLTVTGADGRVLAEGRDYTVSMVRKDSTDSAKDVATNLILNAGTYIITVAGRGNYGGTGEGAKQTVTFTVHPKDIANGDQTAAKVEIAVPSYNLGISRPKAVLTYNGMVLSPSTDYLQHFNSNAGGQGKGDENNPDSITFVGQGNYRGEYTVSVETYDLPEGGLKIWDNNNEYTYQATDLFGYLNYQELSIEEAARNEDRLELGFDNYEVKIASVSDYYKTAGGNEDALVEAEGKILDVDSYMVKMTRKDRPELFGYFFIRIAPRAVTITVMDEEKTYGGAVPEFYYTTNLAILIGSGREQRENEQKGEIDPREGIFVHDVEKGYPTGKLYRAEGEDVGNYYYALNTFYAGPNYTLTVSSDTMFTITPKSLAYVERGKAPDPTRPDDRITVDCKEKVEYTGYPVSPLNSVTYDAELASMGRQTLDEGADYTLTYYRNMAQEGESPNWSELSAAPIAVGEYKVRITGKGNYTNEVEKQFAVVAAGKTLTVALDDEEVTYKAGAYRPKVTVKTEGGALLNSNSYKMTYSYTNTAGKTTVESGSFTSASTEFTDAGTYTIHVNGAGNYVGAYGTATFTILRKDLGDGNDKDGTQPVEVLPIEDQDYTGEAITFDKGLKTVTYAGLEQSPLTGDAVENLQYDKDYDLTYMNNTNAGEATAVLLGKGNYQGSRAVTFQIKPRTIYVEVRNTTKTYGEIDPAYEYAVYGSEDAADPLSGVTLTGKPGRENKEDAGSYPLVLEKAMGSTLSAGSNYEIRWKGEAPKLTIMPKEIGDENENPEARIGASISFMEAKPGAQWPTPSVTYWAATKSMELKEGIDYSVAYYRAGSEEPLASPPTREEDIGDYYALITVTEGGNYAKSIRLPFKVVKEGSYLSLKASEGGTYSPAGKKITLTANYGEENVSIDSGISYTVTCYSSTGKGVTVPVTKGTEACFTAVDAGTYVVTAEYLTGTAENPNTAYGSTAVVVTPKDIGDSTVQVTDIPEQAYTGNAVVPVLAIMDGGKELTPGKDYTVSVTDNVEPNKTATVTITGMGNYAGTAQKTFQIGPMQFTLTYDANGGSPENLPRETQSKDTFSVASGSGMTHANAELEGREYPVLFVGWTDKDNNEKIYQKGDDRPDMFFGGQTLTPAGNATTLYAVWGYDTDGDGRADVVQDAVTVVYDQGTGTTGVPPTDPQTYLIGAVAKARDGGSLAYKQGETAYVFMGWTSTQPGEGVKYAVDTLSDYLKLGGVYAEGAAFYVGSPSNGTFTLYPVWGVDKDGNGTADFLEGEILLIYDANGGTGAPPARECKAGAQVDLAGAGSAAPQRSGAVFLGWTETPEMSLLTAPPDADSYHQAGASYTVPSENTAKHITLYALWAVDENGNSRPDYEEDTYTVTYEAGGGTGDVPTEGTYLSGASVTVPNQGDLEREGYAFGGWSDGAKVYQPGETFTITADITLTAQWTGRECTVTVTVVGEGGTAYIGDNEADKTAKVAYNGAAGITFVPQTGYSLGSVVVNGTAVGADSLTAADGALTLKLEDITSDQTVVATFQSNRFTVGVPESRAYTGSAITPAITVEDGGQALNPDTDYTVEYAAVDGTGAELADDGKPLHAGTYTVTVAGTGSYAGKTAVTTFIITPKPLTDSMVAVAETADGTALSVTVEDGETALEEGTDYTVSYSGSVTPGQEVSVTVTGMGNYMGKILKKHTVSTASQWTLTYISEGTTVRTEQYAKNAVVTVLGKGDLEREGYTFGGWNGGGRLYQPGETFAITADTTLTAVWKEIGKVTLTYHKGSADNGPASEVVTAAPGTEVTVAAGLERSGYTFLGWIPGKTEQTVDSAEEIHSISIGRLYQAGEKLVLTDDTDLCPMWIQDGLLSTYRLVLYRANGGEDTQIASTGFLTAEDSCTVITDRPTRAGWSFSGWNTKADGSGTAYQAGEKAALTGNITFYAQWTKLGACTVVYAGNGAESGDVPTDGKEYQAGAVAAVLGNTGKLAREGYAFSGWNTAADGTGTAYQPGDTFTVDADAAAGGRVILYAVWTKNAVHHVTYHLNGGSGTEPVDEAGYGPGGKVMVKPGTGLTNGAARFAGWSTAQYDQILTDLSAVEILYGEGSSFLMGDRDVVLYAVWITPETMDAYYEVDFDFTVAGVNTYSARSSIATLPSPMFFKPGSTVNIKALQPYNLADGIVFCGWSRSQDGMTLIGDEYITVTSDTTLYAVFATDTCQVYTQAGSGGGITQSGTVPYGGSFTFTVTVDSGYRLDKVTVNGEAVELDSTNSYTIRNIRRDTYVTAFFASVSGGVIPTPDPTPTPTPTPDPTPAPTTDPKPASPDDTGVSAVLNTREHIAFMKGYENGKFIPEGSITRAEVAQMFYNLLLDQDIAITVRFADVPDGAWYAKAVNSLASLGMIGGLGNGLYEPERAITRAEFSAIATRFARKVTAAKTSFVDVPETHWAYQYINVAASYGWVSGYGGNLFGPNDRITRAQAATMVNRMLGRLCDKDAIDRGEGRVFPDVTSSHWAWYQIGEATTEHDFTISEDYLSEIWRK